MVFFKKKEKKNFPYRYYFLSVLVIAFVGVFNSIYLAISHFRVYTDIGYQSFCAISKALNCDTVSQSSYSILLNVPVPILGVLGYTFFLIILIFAIPGNALHRRVWTILFLIALGFSVYSLFLAFVSSYMIQSYCIMCILSYAVNFALLFLTWLIRKRFKCESIFTGFCLDIKYLLNFSISFRPILVIFCIGFVLIFFLIPPYWEITPPALSANVAIGITQEGHPWIGAVNPDLTIVEFADYLCFQCKKMHYFLRQIVQKNPDKIRLIHRHFPMDHTVNPIVDSPFHVGAGKLAIVALLATEREKFWQINDLLFNIDLQKEAVNIQELAKISDIDVEEFKNAITNQEFWVKLRKDIQDGIQYGITGTPGFLINEQVYLGNIPAEVFEKYF